MNSQLKQALDDLNETIIQFNENMSKQMVQNMEIKKKLAETKKLLEEIKHEQDNYNNEQ